MSDLNLATLYVEEIKKAHPIISTLLNRGASAEELASFRSSIKTTLPELFYQFYACHNGSTNAIDTRGLKLLSLKSILTLKQVMDDISNTKKSIPWDSHWVPFLDNESYDTLVIDTQGSVDNQAGRILCWSKDRSQVRVMYESFEKWLETLLAKLNAGIVYALDDENENEELAWEYIGYELPNEDEQITRLCNPGLNK